MIKRFFVEAIEAISISDSAATDSKVRDAALRKATAVLMLDVARADQVFDQSELDRVLELVASHFGLSEKEAAELIDDADEEAEDLTSVHQFTQLLHEHLNEDEKARIVSLLWQIAYADGQLDKYEDSLVLKISDLLYVSRGRVMRLKHDAELAARQ